MLWRWNAHTYLYQHRHAPTSNAYRPRRGSLSRSTSGALSRTTWRNEWVNCNPTARRGSPNVDLVFVGLAAACVMLARAPSVFLWAVLAEFGVTAAWAHFPAGDPWWFLSYACLNCAFAWRITPLAGELSREFSWTLIGSATLAVAVFIEFFAGGGWLHGARPGIMAGICLYQIWLAAVGAGLVEGTLMGAARGVFARGGGRFGRSGADRAPGSVDREV